jgi:hypothetical protein
LEPPRFWSVAESKDLEKSAKRRIREKNFRKLKKGLYDEFGGTGSQIGFVNDLLEKHRGSDLEEDDVLLDCTEYRIVYRHVARPTDERTFIAAVIPKGAVCHIALTTIRPYQINADEADLSTTPLHTVYERVFSDRELFACVGLLNSIVFDYLMRTKIDSNIVMYKFKESQLPRLTEEDQWFDYVWKRAAKLNCYGEEFADMRDRLGNEPVMDIADRRQLRAKIDAAAFHAIGLNNKEAEYILSTFHKVSNPRIMDDLYFESVLSEFRSLQ